MRTLLRFWSRVAVRSGVVFAVSANRHDCAEDSARYNGGFFGKENP